MGLKLRTRGVLEACRMGSKGFTVPRNFSKDDLELSVMGREDEDDLLWLMS